MCFDSVLENSLYRIKMLSEGKRVLTINFFRKNKEINSFFRENGINIIEVDNVDLANECETLFIIISNLSELNEFKNNFEKYYFKFSKNLLIYFKNIKNKFDELENFLIKNKLSKHPFYYEFNSYEESNKHLFGVYRKINIENCNEINNLSYMSSEANLHLDMTRVNGIRSAGHIIRYKIATDFIRIGDVVLDCACGLGYGSDILVNSPAQKVIGVDYSEFAINYASSIFKNSKSLFIKADAQKMDFIPDNSIDFITSFETLEHIIEPEKFLKEAFRVLKPSGRIMLSVPNNWADESGKDPNPEHLHVYNEKKLYKQISKNFLPELKWALTMNRYYEKGKKYYINPFLRKLSLEEELPDKTECILFLAMKDPLLGCDIPYKESSWGEYEENSIFLNFSKYYSNPYLIKGFQSYGYHENLMIRKKIAYKILEDYDITTPEYGGALCFLGYRKLEKSILSECELKDLLNKIETYINNNNDDNPHIFRWKISLAYLMGCVCVKNNNYELGKKYFLLCVNSDITKFSPTLGIKVISACRYLADLSTDNNAKVLYWKKSLELLPNYFSYKNWVNIIGSINKPFPTGLEEMKNILNLVEKSAWDILLEGNQFANKNYGLRDSIKACYLKNESINLKNENINLKNELSNIYLSRSWKITSLFRKVGNILRKNKNTIINLSNFYTRDLKKVIFLINKQKNIGGTICIFSPMYDEENLKDGYYRRVKALDDIFKGYLKIHINTINYYNNKLKIEFFTNNVINVAYNPESNIQILQLQVLLFLSGKMYTHSIWQMKEWALNFPFVKKFVDLHGVVPEEYRLYGDYINAQEADIMEEKVVQKVNYMIAVTEEMKLHMINKYKDKIKADFIIMPIYEENICDFKKINDAKLINNQSIVVYAGGTQKWQLIPEMQKAMIDTSANVYFEICVPKPSEFFEIWGDKTYIKNMTVESRTHGEVLKIYERSHYGFVLREDIAVNNVACPTKLVEYMENGIIPILSTPKIGDFYKMGMEFINLEDFINGRLPTESERTIMIEKNKLILKEYKQQYLNGKEKLLERMK